MNEKKRKEKELDDLKRIIQKSETEIVDLKQELPKLEIEIAELKRKDLESNEYYLKRNI